MSQTTNLYRLTTSHRAVQSKKRALRNQIKQVIFDEDDRREYLTGFHKRKVARTEAARARAKEKEKADRLEARRQRRHALREQVAENVMQLERAFGAVSDDSDEEWHGIGAPSKSGEARRDEEYENEEILATVTVVEDFDPDILVQGPSHPELCAELYPKSAPQRSKSSHHKPKSKSAKVHYDTKDNRQKERAKQHARKLEKAERASGKASRKSGVRRRKR